MDAAIGTELSSSIATRHRAFAAINAGFFRLDKSQFAGDAAGILMIDGHLLSEPLNNRIQLLINNNRDRTNVLIARTTLALAVKFGNHALNLTGINRERKKDDLIIYTPEFGRTTLTDGDGIEVVVEHGKAASLTTNIGNSVIPKDGFVISAGDKFREALADAADSPAPVSIVRTWDAPADLAKDTTNLDVVAGVPQLIKNGKIDMTWELEKSSKSFVETRHPRTAVAKLKDGKFLMITVDGRTESSGGIGDRKSVV